jgi:phage protein D
VEFAANQLPTANDANWFSSQKEIFCEILAGFPQDPTNPQPSEMLSLIYGRIDNIDYNPRDALIAVTGRDLTGAFIDNKLFEEYQNKTASQIAIMLATNRGLDTANVTATSTLVGTYYTRDQVKMTADRSEWDLLCWLAREEGFVCFVEAQSLYFEPDPRGTSDPYIIQWTPRNGSPLANVVGITFQRTLTVAKGITVTVRSPSLTKKTAVTVSYPTAPKSITAGKSSPFGTTQPYYYTLPAGKTPQECEAYAQQKYADIISHEMKLTMSLPADNTMSISLPIQVQGTGTYFDQLYYPRLITREMGIDSGYLMTVEAQNNAPDNSL